MLTVADNPAAEAYRNQRDRLHAIERRPHALETISQAQDPEVLREALEDLLKFSYTTEENLTALEMIETVLTKISEANPEHQKVALFNAKALRRLSRMEEGDAIFERAFKEKWGQAQYENERSLLEIGDFAGAAVHEFERVSGLLHGDVYQVPPYEEGIEDLGRFKMYLGRLKADAPATSAMEAVFSRINVLGAPSLMTAMARALCLSEDGYSMEALDVIERAKVDNANENPVWKYIPLYQSMALMDLDNVAGAQNAFREFMAALGGNYKVIHSAGIRFARSLELTEKSRGKMSAITSLMINSPITQNEEVMATFSNYEIAHLYDLHSIGLSWGGHLEAGAAVSFDLFTRYFPDNLAGAHGALSYARFLTWYNGGDLDAAMRILNRIVTEAPFDAIMPWVRLSQSEILLKRGERFQAVAYIQDAMTRSLMNDGGVERDVLIQALKLQQEALGYYAQTRSTGHRGDEQ